MIGALLIGASLWYVNVRLAAPIVRAFGAEELTRLGERFAEPPIVPRLLIVALLPACCEELLSRGVLARALRPATGRIAAVLLSALCFAGFHLSIVRFAPTFTLGAVLAAVTLAADSIWPAIAAHALNNAIAIAVAGGALPSLAEIVSSHPDGCLIASAALSATGLVIALAPRHPV
jgi:membrane protease YdiL (CAAX protease family)